MLPALERIAHHIRERGGVHEHPRTGVLEQRTHLDAAVAVVQRNGRDRAGEAGEEGHEVFGAVVEQDRDRVPRPEPCLREVARQRAGVARELPVSHGAVGRDDRGSVTECTRDFLPHVAVVASHPNPFVRCRPPGGGQPSADGGVRSACQW